MAGYTPQTHFTCCLCKRQRPNSKRHETLMRCSDRAGCLRRSVALIGSMVFAQRVTVNEHWL